MNPTTTPFSFCPVLAEIMRAGETVGQTGRRLETSSMSTSNNILVLRNIHLALRAKQTLETGFRFGGSCLAFTQTHKDLGAPPDRQHVAIDPYQRSPFNDSSGLLAIERAGLSGYLDFREEFSSKALPQLLQEGRSFQLIHIDGSHNFEDVFIDMFYSAQLLERGGVVIFDDSPDPHIKTVLRFVRKNMSHCLAEIELATFHPNASIKYRVARSLGRQLMTGFKKIGEFERPHGYRLATF